MLVKLFFLPLTTLLLITRQILPIFRSVCIKICAGLKFLRVLNKGIHNFGVGTSENHSFL